MSTQSMNKDTIEGQKEPVLKSFSYIIIKPTVLDTLYEERHHRDQSLFVHQSNVWPTKTSKLFFDERYQPQGETEDRLLSIHIEDFNEKLPHDSRQRLGYVPFYKISSSHENSKFNTKLLTDKDLLRYKSQPSNRKPRVPQSSRTFYYKIVPPSDHISPLDTVEPLKLDFSPEQVLSPDRIPFPDYSSPQEQDHLFDIRPTLDRGPPAEQRPATHRGPLPDQSPPSDRRRPPGPHPSPDQDPPLGQDLPPDQSPPTGQDPLSKGRRPPWRDRPPDQGPPTGRGYLSGGRRPPWQDLPPDQDPPTGRGPLAERRRPPQQDLPPVQGPPTGRGLLLEGYRPQWRDQPPNRDPSAGRGQPLHRGQSRRDPPIDQDPAQELSQGRDKDSNRNILIDGDQPQRQTIYYSYINSEPQNYTSNVSLLPNLYPSINTNFSNNVNSNRNSKLTL